MRKHYLLLFLVLISAFFLRTIFLEKIPIGISDDELEYIFNAKSIFLTGKDITQDWSPLTFTTPPLETPKGEIPYLLIAPFVGPFSFSLFTARIGYVFFNMLFICTLYIISRRFFDEKHALITAFVAAFNPYMIYFSRTAFDAPVASFFFFAFFASLLYLKGKKLLLSIPIFTLAFFSYIGTKVIFLPLITLFVYFSWRLNKGKYKKIYTIILISCLTVFVYYLVQNFIVDKNPRSHEIASPFHPSISAMVNDNRRMSIQTPLNSYFENKFTVFTSESINKYLGAFSPQTLFLYGDSRSTFSTWKHGYFYILDLFFLIVGFYYLFRHKREILYFLSVLALISPIPTALSTVGTTYPIRSTLLFPTLILVASTGIWHCYNLLKKRKGSKLFFVFFACVYTILIINYLHLYLIRNPIYNSEGFGFSGRVLASYIYRASLRDQNVVFIENESYPALRQFLFYNNLLNKNSVKELSNTFKNSKKLQYMNFSIGQCPDSDTTETKTTYIVPAFSKCGFSGQAGKDSVIPQLSDGGTVYRIENDFLCNQKLLNSYPSNFKLHEFNVESLTNQEFCKTFITHFEFSD